MLYKLPELIEAVASGHPVFVVEGEKDVAALAKLSIVATTNAGGAGKWRPEYNENLRGVDVVLIPDNDDAGWAHVHQIGNQLYGLARLRVLVLPGVPAKGDVSDWIAAGGTREQLDTLVAQAPEWKPSQTTGAEQSGEKTTATAREDELLAALTKSKGLDYDRKKKAAAKELGVSAKAIDDEIKARREDAEVAPLYGHWIVEPWPEPVEAPLCCGTLSAASSVTSSSRAITH